MSINRKPFQDLEFKDAFMFATVMGEPELCGSVLERILGFPIREVKVHTENAIVFNPDYRSVRLDVYADDEEGTVYDVEMQTTDHRNLPKRSRCYQGQMDVGLLRPGEDFNKLPQSFVIFICTFDPCGRGRYRYTFRECCQEDGELLGDGTCKIFLNTKGTNAAEVPKELVSFLSYVESSETALTDSEDKLVRQVRERVASVKKNRRLEERYMLFGEIIDEERAEAREEGQREGLKKGLKEGLKAGHAAGQTELLKLLAAMNADGRTSDIPRLSTEPEFLSVMLEKYQISGVQEDMQE